MTRYFAINAQIQARGGPKMIKFCTCPPTTAKILEFQAVSIFIGVQNLLRNVSKCFRGI